MKHRFVEEALVEFIAAGRYYNQQVPGLGDAFVDEVEAGILLAFSVGSSFGGYYPLSLTRKIRV
jgi:hypothetical protein